MLVTSASRRPLTIALLAWLALLSGEVVWWGVGAPSVLDRIDIGNGPYVLRGSIYRFRHTLALPEWEDAVMLGQLFCRHRRARAVDPLEEALSLLAAADAALGAAVAVDDAAEKVVEEGDVDVGAACSADP